MGKPNADQYTEDSFFGTGSPKSYRLQSKAKLKEMFASKEPAFCGGNT
jgi:hypothetical protein